MPVVPYFFALSLLGNLNSLLGGPYFSPYLSLTWFPHFIERAEMMMNWSAGCDALRCAGNGCLSEGRGHTFGKYFSTELLLDRTEGRRFR